MKLLLVTDEEYLGGACMDWPRAWVGDNWDGRRLGITSVTTCIAVGQILEFLFYLDFRNGPLRRKYDGTKYSLKSLERSFTE
jgi:hypothetical protein